MDFLIQEEEQQTQVNNSVDDKAWRILVVDDDVAVHQITRLVLADVTVENRKLELVPAYSSEQAKEILLKDNSFCMAFVDVVMETDHAGLALVEWIRHELKNQAIRLILRTGQAGSAPEATVIKEFDINDYKEKTDFTSGKMVTSVYAAIRAYRDIMTIQRSLDAFKQLIKATHDLLQISQFKPFGSAALHHLLTLMEVDSSALYIARRRLDEQKNNMIIACTGKYIDEADSLESSNIDAVIKQRIQHAFNEQESSCDQDCFIGYYKTAEQVASVLYIEFEDDAEHFKIHLAEPFATSIALILESLMKQKQV